MFQFISKYCNDLASDVCGAEGSSYDDVQRYERSNDLSERARSRVEESMQLRSVFLTVEPIAVNPVSGHTHGSSAASRSSASLMIDQLAATSGRNPVFYQGSAADLRKGRAITRTWHWAKDQNVEPRTHDKGDNDMVAMVDVDYYVDMPRFLVRNFVPTVLYTFQPGSVCKEDGEYKYTFNKDNEVVYSVSGGGAYCHPVWNYTGDSVGVKQKFLGFTVAYATYSVERKVLDEDHQLVLLAPLNRFGFWTCRKAEKILASPVLERLEVVQGNYTRMATNSSDGIKFHTGKVGEYIKAVTSPSVDGAIASAVVTSKVAITLGTVKSKMAVGRTITAMDGPQFAGAEVLLEYHSKWGKKDCATVSTLDTSVRSYQFAKRIQDIDEDAKPGMVAFMQPLVDEAFVPDSSKNNDRRGIEKRVKEIANVGEMTPFLQTVMQEFVDRLVGNARHSLHPVEEDVVYEKQAKPSQQRILHEADHSLPDRRVSSFGKREAGMKCGDPRNISTINGVDKREYSRYMYALATYVKQFEWYAFGKTPAEVATRVAEICTLARYFIDSTDFSRMDGRVNKVARTLEEMIMLALFHPRYHVEILELMRSQHSLKGKTRFGVLYETLWSRLSGSPETSLFNTILSAFCAFLALRMTRENGAFLTAVEAWDRLGLYGGDDAMNSDVPKENQEKAARMLGQLLTIDRVKRYDLGVNFLSRQYGPDVWTGEPDSCCDIKRQLSKLHVTVSLPSNITPERKLLEKCYALVLTDANTPIIGEFAKRALTLHGSYEYENILGIWNSDLDRSVHYPNRWGSWMEDIVDQTLPDFDRGRFCRWLDRSGRTSSLLRAPVFVERSNPQAPVDGDALFVDGDAQQIAAATPIRVDERKPTRARKPKSDRGERKPRSGGGSTGGKRRPRGSDAEFETKENK